MVQGADMLLEHYQTIASTQSQQGLDLQSTSEAGNACVDSFISITTHFKLWNKVGLYGMAPAELPFPA